VNKLPKAKSHNILVQETASEVLIYNTENNEVYCLNETAAFVWQNCDGTKTISDLNQMNNQLNDDLIFLTLDLLKQKDLLDETPESYFPTEAIDRRKMFAKYGTMAIALPLITAVIAPKSVQAQSCVDRSPLDINNPGPANCSECPAVNAAITNALACCPGTAPAFFSCDAAVCTYNCRAI
jgi:Coenzyme PQQ synthesis protein D (PqqD)